MAITVKYSFLRHLLYRHRQEGIGGRKQESGRHNGEMDEGESGGDECPDHAGGGGGVLASLHGLRRHTDRVAGRRGEDVGDAIAREGRTYFLLMVFAPFVLDALSLLDVACGKPARRRYWM